MLACMPGVTFKCSIAAPQNRELDSHSMCVQGGRWVCLHAEIAGQPVRTTSLTTGAAWPSAHHVRRRVSKRGVTRHAFPTRSCSPRTPCSHASSTAYVGRAAP